MTEMERDHCRCVMTRKANTAATTWKTLLQKQVSYECGSTEGTYDRNILPPRVRGKVISLLRRVQSGLEFSEKALFRAMRMVDKICESTACRFGEDVELLALACLHIVTKHIDTANTHNTAPTILRFAKVRFSVADFRMLERRVLNGMLMGVSAPDSVDFLRTMFAFFGEAEDKDEEVTAFSTTVTYTGERQDGSVPLSGLETAGFKVQKETLVENIFGAVAAKFGVEQLKGSLTLFRMRKNACGVTTARFVVNACGVTPGMTAEAMGITPGCSLFCTTDISKNFLLYNSRERRGVPYQPNRGLFKSAEVALSRLVSYSGFAKMTPSESASVSLAVAVIATSEDASSASSLIRSMETTLKGTDMSCLLERHAQTCKDLLAGCTVGVNEVQRALVTEGGGMDANLPPLLCMAESMVSEETTTFDDDSRTVCTSSAVPLTPGSTAYSTMTDCELDASYRLEPSPPPHKEAHRFDPIIPPSLRSKTIASLRSVSESASDFFSDEQHQAALDDIWEGTTCAALVNAGIPMRERKNYV